MSMNSCYTIQSNIYTPHCMFIINKFKDYDYESKKLTANLKFIPFWCLHEKYSTH